jgi:hypothetical protein
VPNAKRTPVPVKTSAAPDKASKDRAKAARASIDRGERQHAGVIAAVPRSQRLRIQPVRHSAALARD